MYKVPLRLGALFDGLRVTQYNIEFYPLSPSVSQL